MLWNHYSRLFATTKRHVRLAASDSARQETVGPRSKSFCTEKRGKANLLVPNIKYFLEIRWLFFQNKKLGGGSIFSTSGQLFTFHSVINPWGGGHGKSSKKIFKVPKLVTHVMGCFGTGLGMLFHLYKGLLVTHEVFEKIEKKQQKKLLL